MGQPTSGHQRPTSARSPSESTGRAEPLSVDAPSGIEAPPQTEPGSDPSSGFGAGESMVSGPGRLSPAIRVGDVVLYTVDGGEELPAIVIKVSPIDYMLDLAVIGRARHGGVFERVAVRRSDDDSSWPEHWRPRP